jgi:hypothetical protein
MRMDTTSIAARANGQIDARRKRKDFMGLVLLNVSSSVIGVSGDNKGLVYRAFFGVLFVQFHKSRAGRGWLYDNTVNGNDMGVGAVT